LKSVRAKKIRIDHWRDTDMQQALEQV